MVANRGWVDSDQVDAFLAAGYTHRHVLDVILGVGMKTLSNYTNHIADTHWTRHGQHGNERRPTHDRIGAMIGLLFTGPVWIILLDTRLYF